MYSLEPPHRGDSNEYTQYIIFNINTKCHPKLSQICSYGNFPRTQERVRNSRGKRVISVRAIEVILYLQYLLQNYKKNITHFKENISFQVKIENTCNFPFIYASVLMAKPSLKLTTLRRLLHHNQAALTTRLRRLSHLLRSNWELP